MKIAEQFHNDQDVKRGKYGYERTKGWVVNVVGGVNGKLQASPLV